MADDTSSPFLSPLISAFRRIPLFEAPTALHHAPRLSSELGPDVFVKRDDLTVLGLGGNKVRKLEYLMGRAQADGCDTIVTFGETEEGEVCFSHYSNSGTVFCLVPSP